MERSAHPDMCHRYYDCHSTSNDTNNPQFQPVEHECAYPQLFDDVNKTCAHFSEVECGDRLEAKNPCGFTLCLLVLMPFTHRHTYHTDTYTPTDERSDKHGHTDAETGGGGGGRLCTTDDFTTNFLHIFFCPSLPSWTLRTPGLSISLCCLPTSSFVCLLFSPLPLCLAKWFWPDLMN